jgi:hypothetical protein
MGREDLMQWQGTRARLAAARTGQNPKVGAARREAAPARSTLAAETLNLTVNA